MRAHRASDRISLHAVAGTYVVLLGINMTEEDCDALMGFAIHRTDRTEEEAYWMEGLKTFEATDPGFPPGAKYSTRQHPIQGFTWSDFSAKPGHDYTFRVVALKGTPQDLQPFAEVSVDVRTESPDGGTHDIYFNRGAAASQEYARRFGNGRPDELGKAAFNWLSRGLFESMLEFIARAKDATFALRVCAYEFHYLLVLEALGRAARERGVDVRIIYDRRSEKPGDDNEAAVETAEIGEFCIKRTANPSYISHNKFIVLLEDGEPQAVLTGGTNFSEGGIFGHSNAVHIVEEPSVAAKYLRYWELLAANPEVSKVARTLTEETSLPDGKPPEGVLAIFSPRRGLKALEWYAEVAAGVQEALFMTFAFGIHPLFQEVYRRSEAKLRYALLEKATRPMKRGPERDAEEAKIRDLRALLENRFAIGAHIEMNKFDRWRGERLSGLNRNVQYVHTKYMLVDPLGADPIVIAGSANFSAASTNQNDENMLIIRGNRRVADIYLGEFMRLYNHYAFREWAAKQRFTPNTVAPSPSHLRTDDWWREYFGNTERARQREYFAG